MGLANDYRPTKFDELLGNEGTKKAIMTTLGSVHCYLFFGPRGCGKTTTARIIANELGCSKHDLFELNAADNTGIDDARAIISSAALAPMVGNVKVYIIDECHRFTSNAQDSMLKILEEPPSHVYFILCTTDPRKVIDTIKSRAQQGMFQFNPLKRKDMSALIRNVMEAESITLAPQVLRSVINNSEGIPRDALGILEKVSTIDDEEEALEVARFGSAEDSDVKELIKILLKDRDWVKAREVLKRMKAEPEQARRAILGYLGKVLLDGDSPIIYTVMTQFEDDYFASGRAGLYISVFAACHISESDDIPF